MAFRVSYKGVTQHLGGLESVYEFLTRRWGTSEKAFEIGVKVEPVL